MAWHGMAWHGMAWHGMAWHGKAWLARFSSNNHASPLQLETDFAGQSSAVAFLPLDAALADLLTCV